MRFKLPNGKFVWKNIEKFRVDWDKKERSIVQFKTKQFLKPYWGGKVIYSEMPIPGTRLKCDLVNTTDDIAIEVSGNQHFAFNSHFHNNSRSSYLKSIFNDDRKRKFLELNGFRVIEIHEKEVPLLTRKWFFEKFGIKL